MILKIKVGQQSSSRTILNFHLPQKWKKILVFDLNLYFVMHYPATCAASVVTHSLSYYDDRWLLSNLQMIFRLLTLSFPPFMNLKTSPSCESSTHILFESEFSWRAMPMSTPFLKSLISLPSEFATDESVTSLKQVLGGAFCSVVCDIQERTSLRFKCMAGRPSSAHCTRLPSEYMPIMRGLCKWPYRILNVG